MKDHRSGVYEIRHNGSGARYVGSAVDFQARWLKHLSEFRRGAHHNLHLQRAWDKYGEAAFSFKKLLVCSKENLVMYEQIVMDATKPEYNILPRAGSALGRKMSQAFREGLSRRKKGVSPSAETRAKISAKLTGRKLNWTMTEEQRAAARVRCVAYAAGEGRAHYLKLAEAKRGIPRPPDVRKKLSIGSSKLTEEQVKSIRARYETGELQKHLAAEFGIRQSCVSEIVRRVTYGWVD